MPVLSNTCAQTTCALNLCAHKACALEFVCSECLCYIIGINACALNACQRYVSSEWPVFQMLHMFQILSMLYTSVRQMLSTVTVLSFSMYKYILLPCLRSAACVLGEYGANASYVRASPMHMQLLYVSLQLSGQSHLVHEALFYLVTVSVLWMYKPLLVWKGILQAFVDTGCPLCRQSNEN